MFEELHTAGYTRHLTDLAHTVEEKTVKLARQEFSYTALLRLGELAGELLCDSGRHDQKVPVYHTRKQLRKLISFRSARRRLAHHSRTEMAELVAALHGGREKLDKDSTKTDRAKIVQQ